MANVAFLFYFSTNSFAGSTLVIGNNDSLSVFANTRYLDNKPVLIFTEQVEDKKFQLLNKIENIVLCDSTWRNLAIQVTGSKLQIAGQNMRVNIEKSGNYEIYLDASKIEEETPEFEIKIGGKTWILDTGYWILDRGRKYVKVGEVELEEGEHVTAVHSPQSTVHSQKDEEIKLVLVNREEREHIEEIIWQKINNPETEVAYIFSQDGEFYVP